jgi:diguanylate cyclase (GGDEF)-like protein
MRAGFELNHLLFILVYCINMISSSIFFWVLPVMFAVFACVFASLARSDGGSAAARKGAAAFGIGAFAIILDTQRQYFPSGLYVVAVPLHWLVLIYTVNAFLSRHRQSIAFKPASTVFLVGTVINFCATFINEISALRAPNTMLTAATLLALSLPKLYNSKPLKLDRMIAIAITALLCCYLVRLTVYISMNQTSEYIENSQWTQFMLIFYFTSGLAALCLALLLIVTITKDVIERYHAENTHDSLTGIINRRGFEKMIEMHVSGKPEFGAIMMIDLDRFKHINDRYGHAVGDQVLIAAARTISDGCHGFGEVARIGGEEFAVLVRATHAEAALQLAELLRTSIAVTHLSAPFDGIDFTASIGVANIEPDESISDAMRRADLALFRGKEAGRDRVAYARSGFSVTSAAWA